MLKEHGIEELNPAQGRIIYELWRKDGITQAELADRAKLDKSTLALMLDRLETQGQVLREADPGDARRRIIRLTAANRALHAAYQAASDEMIALYYKGFTNAEINAFEAALRKTVENLEEALRERG